MTEFSVAFQTDHPLAEYGPLAASAEAYGFDVVSVYNDLFYQPAWLPLLEIARHTQRIRLGPAAINPFTCHPINIAGNIALIDEASQGRAYLGLARGAWLDQVGIEPKRTLASLPEAFECVSRLLARDKTAYRGRFFPLAGGNSLRWSVWRPQIPYLLGAWGPQTIRACIKYVNEIKIGGTANVALVTHYRRLVDQAAIDAGRKPADVRLVVGAVSVVSEDGGAARALARRRVGLYLSTIAKLDFTLGLEPELLERIAESTLAHDYERVGQLIPDSMLELLSFSGIPEEVVAHAKAIIAAGADRIEFGAPHGQSHEEGLQLLGERVLPALRNLP